MNHTKEGYILVSRCIKRKENFFEEGNDGYKNNYEENK